jgi:tetratricopeptide (TPR) repeat protein
MTSVTVASRERVARIRPVRVPIIILVACCVAAPAETIHLKNGRQILADHVRQTTSQVEYDIGDDSYAIPKTLVERVDAGGAPIHSHAEAVAAPEAVLPSFSSSIDVHEDALSLKIIRDGRVDEEALAALERSGDPALGASGYFVAGKFAYERGRRDQAREYFHRALMFQPDHGPALTYYAAALMQSGSLAEAAPIAERETPGSPKPPPTRARFSRRMGGIGVRLLLL